MRRGVGRGNMTFRGRLGLPAAWGVAAFAVGLTAAGQSAHALVIDALFDSSVTAAQQAIVDNAISFYDQAFIDPITVAIEFVTAASGAFAGQSQTGLYTASYGNYTSALQQDALAYNNQVELSGYDSLAHGNQASLIRFTSADGRALGCSACAPGVAGQGSISGMNVDGIVTVNQSFFDTTVVQHEIDEVLGIGGTGTILPSLPATNGSVIGPLDLFRYGALDSPSLTTSASATAYLSFDAGATVVAPYNQSGTGDYGDFAGPGCFVQSFAACGSPTVSVASPEGQALQAIGYDVAVPEPATVALLGGGLLGLSVIHRRKRARG